MKNACREIITTGFFMSFTLNQELNHQLFNRPTAFPLIFLC